MSPSKYTDEIEKRAKQVWEVMHREAYNRGMALQREPKYGDGRVIINTVGAFIKGLNKERGWELDENKIDLVRRFLKASGNVVVLTKIEQYKFRIFIREAWHDGVLVVEPVTKENPSRADKISPHDAGEDREPAPVIYKCHCGSEWPSQNSLNSHKKSHVSKEQDESAHHGARPLEDDDAFIISEHQTAILLALKEMGGSISHDSGRVSSVIQQATGLSVESVSNTARTLKARGYIARDVNAKRTYRMWLTKEGKEVLANLNHYRASGEVVADFLSAKGAFTAPKRKLYESLSEAIGGLNADRASNGVRVLEDKGLVEVLRDSPSSYPHGIVWKGEKRNTVAENIAEVDAVKDAALDEPEDEPTPRLDKTLTEPTVFDKPIPSIPLKAKWLTDEALLNLLEERLAKPKVDPKTANKLQQALELLDLVNGLVKDANSGKSSPLKTLADIEDALRTWGGVLGL